MMQSSRLYQRLVQRQLLAASIVVLGFAGAHAQDATTLPPVNVAPADEPPAQVLPPTSPEPGPGSAPSKPSASADPCKGDGGKGLGCLNQKLKNQVDQASSNASTPTAPLDARSPDLKIGVVNVPGVQQQYGKNFGVSAVPYRPPQVFSAPLGRH
jgi:hypothetical protein